MGRAVRVALVGQRFMGRAHANAYMKVVPFFDPPLRPVLQVVCGRDEGGLAEFAQRFGFAGYTIDWRQAVTAKEVDLVDICAPNDLHAEITVTAAEAGKAVFCEKPLARDLVEAGGMLEAVERAGVPHMVCFNYRFFPAIQLARELIHDGALGEVRQFRAIYLQDWLVDPGFPRTWRLVRARAGSGALGDTAVHIVDLARFLVGKIAEVVGMLSTFVKERPLPDGPGIGAVDVDDAAAFLTRFEDGAVGVFETTRMAAGRKNFLHLEVNGSRGSLFWNAEDPNVLWFHSEKEPATSQGFRRVVVTEPGHPYAGHWWPPGHILGYEHSFVHAVYELLSALAEGRNPEPDFRDGVWAQAVLEAVLRSAEERRWVAVAEVLGG
jgi:predicted dehydrogenase